VLGAAEASMSVVEHTRRRFLEVSAGAVGGLLGASAGLVQLDSAGAQSVLTDVIAGELRIFAGGFVPVGWLACDGQQLAAADQPVLARAIGRTFGGDGKDHVRVPDLRGRALVGSGDPSGSPPHRIGQEGKALAVSAADNDPSTLALTYLIAAREEPYGPLIGEVRAFSFQFAPRGWTVCDGRALNAIQHPELFTIIGTRFGGEAASFSLPDLRSATPLSHGHGPGLPSTPIGQRREDLAPGGPSRHVRLHVTYGIALAGNYPIRSD
jgi:microcystin-dependent protein